MAATDVRMMINGEDRERATNGNEACSYSLLPSLFTVRAERYREARGVTERLTVPVRILLKSAFERCSMEAKDCFSFGNLKPIAYPRSWRPLTNVPSAGKTFG